MPKLRPMMPKLCPRHCELKFAKAIQFSHKPEKRFSGGRNGDELTNTSSKSDVVTAAGTSLRRDRLYHHRVIIADSWPRFAFGVVVSLAIAALPGLWAYRAFTGKKAWPGPGKVPRIHGRGEPSANAAPFPSVAAPLCLAFLLLALILALDHLWHINFAGTGPRQQSASQNILGAFFIIPFVIIISLGVFGKPRFLIPNQYKTKDGLDWSKVARTRADAPTLSVVRPWLRQHTIVRLILVTAVCAWSFVYGTVSLNHILAHQSTPPFWSLLLTVAYAAIWTLMTVAGVSTKTLDSPPLVVFPKSTRGAILIALVIPFFIAFSQLPSRSGTSDIAIPVSLQVIGKSAMICAALSVFIVSVTRALIRRRRKQGGLKSDRP
jgi:hypothetical protein